ncbi:MAG: DUF2268 domain-containing putative Zn-dependent protease [Gemmatimonadaceae bacterium]
MLINLLPDFFAVLDSTDRVAAYLRYFEAHRRMLEPYWTNYVLDPEGPHFQEVVRSTVYASRDDLRSMLARVDVVTLARAAEAESRRVLEADVDTDVVLMVGVGAANAGELVVGGRGMAFIALEHFTGQPNPDTTALGLEPELIPLWLAHEIAHAVRYTSPTTQSEMRQLTVEAGGNYDYWETGRRATLGELIINEGIAVQASRLVSPGHAAWEYFGYARKEYARVREAEPFIMRTVARQLDRSGLGLRLRYLSGGMSDDARTVDRHVLPERSGYFVGARLTDAAVASRGLAWTVRATATDIIDAGAAHHSSIASA